MSARAREPFWLDLDYDARNSDVGTSSRYANYLRANRAMFADIDYDDPRVEFAAVAWRIANGPIMSPPLVRTHPRVRSATVSGSDWNGEAIVDVTLVSPRPAVLSSAKTTTSVYYRDWRADGWEAYAGVGGDDLSRAPSMLTEVRMLLQIPPGTLPRIHTVPAGDALFAPAISSVEVLVSYLNREVGPVIEQLDGLR